MNAPTSSTAADKSLPVDSEVEAEISKLVEQNAAKRPSQIETDVERIRSSVARLLSPDPSLGPGRLPRWGPGAALKPLSRHLDFDSAIPRFRSPRADFPVWTNPRDFRHLRVFHRVSGRDCLEFLFRKGVFLVQVSARQFSISVWERERLVRQPGRDRFVKPHARAAEYFQPSLPFCAGHAVGGEGGDEGVVFPSARTSPSRRSILEATASLTSAISSVERATTRS